MPEPTSALLTAERLAYIEHELSLMTVRGEWLHIGDMWAAELLAHCRAQDERIAAALNLLRQPCTDIDCCADGICDVCSEREEQTITLLKGDDNA